MPGKSQNTVEYESTRLADYTDDESAERGAVDISITVLVILLLVIGTLMVLSSSYARAFYDVTGESGGNATYYFVRQTIFALCGVAFMFLCSRFPMSFYRRISIIVLAAALVLLLLVPFIGTRVNGARRWIDLGFTTFQPSELAKIGVIMFFAVLICHQKEKMRTLRGVVPFLVVLAMVCALLAMEPHMSATIIILAIGLVMLFVGGGRLWWFMAGGGSMAALLGLGYLLVPYVRDRFTAWQNPFADLRGDGWQVVQSLYAIGSGGLLGLGLGNSRQKYLYLPEEHNDYIFSIVCEELGFIGAVLILVLFALLIIRCYYVSMHARDKYSLLVGVGITTLFALQVFFNVAVCTNTIPSTGISLPLFSYGGSALLIQMAEMGIMLSISRDVPEKN